MNIHSTVLVDASEFGERPDGYDITVSDCCGHSEKEIAEFVIREANGCCGVGAVRHTNSATAIVRAYA